MTGWSRFVPWLVAIAVHASRKFTKYSAIRKFGITAQTCAVAAKPASTLL